MTPTLDRRVSKVYDAVRGVSPLATIEQVGRLSWQFPLDGRTGELVTAQLDEDWLVLKTPSSLRSQRPWDLLELHNSVAGAKIAADWSPSSIHALAEIPTDDEVDLLARTAEALAGLAALAASGSDGGQQGWASSNTRDGASVGRDAIDLAGLLAQATWPFVTRASGSLSVDLEIARGFYQAEVCQRTDGCVVVRLDLVRADALSQPTRDALGLLLLTAGGAMRMVRGTAEAAEGQWTAGLEVVFVTPPTGRELGHALSALSVACRQVGRPVRALEDEVVAERYLVARGWGS